MIERVRDRYMGRRVVLSYVTPGNGMTLGRIRLVGRLTFEFIADGEQPESGPVVQELTIRYWWVMEVLS